MTTAPSADAGWAPGGRLFCVKFAGSSLYNPQAEEDRSGACPDCGAGLEYLPPLEFSSENRLNRMKRTGYAHLWIVERGFAEAIQRAGLTGVRFLPASIGRDREGFRWARVDFVLPRASSKSTWDAKNLCACGRGGYLTASRKVGGIPASVLELEYRASDLAAHPIADFNLTWERFFNRKEPASATEGGAAVLVVSARARAFLEQNGPAKQLVFTPVRIA
jgi:hypothetical protein